MRVIKMDFNQMYRDLIDESGVKYPSKSDYTTYFAYKGGESKRFDTYEEAKQFSNNVESNGIKMLMKLHEKHTIK